MTGRSSRTPPHRGPASRAAAPEARRALVAALGLLLSACSQTGDLGRPAPTAWNALVEETGSVAARLREEPVSRFPLTDDEAELRDRAWRFLMPQRDGASTPREAFDALLANLTRARVLPADLRSSEPDAYHAALVAGPARSPVSRYRRLADDAVADGRLVPAFAGLAVRVFAADAVRLRGLPYLETLDQRDVREAALRVAENRCLVAVVRHESAQRARAYRFALEHLVVETPQADAVEAERALAFYDERRRALDDLLSEGAATRCGLPAPALAAAPFGAPAPGPLVVKD